MVGSLFGALPMEGAGVWGCPRCPPTQGSITTGVPLAGRARQHVSPQTALPYLGACGAVVSAACLSPPLPVILTWGAGNSRV